MNFSEPGPRVSLPPEILGGFRPGDRVMVVARSEWGAVIDTQYGKVVGFNGNMVQILIRNPGVPDLTFFLPPDELVLSV